MSAPTPSSLDFNQCIQGAFDESTGRLRVNGEATIVNGMLEVAISSTSGDSILTVGTADGTPSGSQHVLKVDGQGNQSTLQMNALVPVGFDSIFPTYPNAVTEIYTYKANSSTVATVTVIYTDSSKNNITSIVRV